jgi:hypothetical protein
VVLNKCLVKDCALRKTNDMDWLEWFPPGRSFVQPGLFPDFDIKMVRAFVVTGINRKAGAAQKFQ